MAKEKPSIPQGTRDFGPDVVSKREFIFSAIKKTFELYGFQPLETPAMENLDTLMGKYGEDGDKLIFKILNNGLSDPKNIDKARAAFGNVLQGKNDTNLTERALKYDLTIPFARYVAMNHGQLTFPYKRYQMQPVWRADKPQKGRYREFYQCDADVVGSGSLLNEVDLASIYHEVFTRLGITDYELRVNNRKILTALAEMCGGSDKLKLIIIAIDKYDKIGKDGVAAELQKIGLNNDQIAAINRILIISDFFDTNDLILHELRGLFRNIPIGLLGIEEIEFLLKAIPDPDLAKRLVVDTTLARGLDYYTGIIFEVRAPKQVKIGSIGGGGRYDDLTGLFGVPNVPGVGISFGVDRIYDVMEELQLFPNMARVGTQVLFYNFGESEQNVALSLMQKLRKFGIRCELYPEKVNIDKQFKYADKKSIPFVITIGPEELQNRICKIRNRFERKVVSIGIDIIEFYPFKLEETKFDSITTENQFVSKIINKYWEVKTSKKKGVNVHRGRSEIISTYVENLFANYLQNKLHDVEIFVDTLHKFGSMENSIVKYPDISVVHNDEIIAFVDVKIDLGFKRSEWEKEVNNTTYLLDLAKINATEIQYQDDPKMPPIKRPLRTNKNTKYHYVILSSRNISKKIEMSIRELQFPHIEHYFLTDNFHPNDSNLENLSNLKVNYNEFDILVDQIRNTK